MNALLFRGRRLRLFLTPQDVDGEDGIRAAGGFQGCPKLGRGATRYLTSGSALHCARERASLLVLSRSVDVQQDP